MFLMHVCVLLAVYVLVLSALAQDWKRADYWLASATRFTHIAILVVITHQDKVLTSPPRLPRVTHSLSVNDFNFITDKGEGTKGCLG
jgi:hypothetical protein